MPSQENKKQQHSGALGPELFQSSTRQMPNTKSSPCSYVGPVQVLLVEILGEDDITCVDLSPVQLCAMSCFFLGALLLILMSVVLLTNEAAPVMAPWIYPGTNYRHGAICGLVLATAFPIATLAQGMSRRYLYNGL